jgi:hypothetical protein
MATRYSEPDKDGNITVLYDTPEEDPSYREDGQCIEIDLDRQVIATLCRTNCVEFDAQADQIIEKLHAMAAEKLAPGTIYEIRGKIPTDFGRGRGLAWYTSHWMQETEPTAAIPYPGKSNELGGYMYLGTFKAPHHG